MNLLFVIALLACGQTINASGVPTVAMPKNWEQFEKLHGSSMEKLFAQYKQTFGKTFKSADIEGTHFHVFKWRVQNILDWNKDTTKSYTKGINKFTDMTAEERQNYVMPETKMEGKSLPKSSKKHKDDAIAYKPLVGAGDSKNCDLRPFTTAVKNQASCGSCWAFGTVAAAEASHFLWSQTDAAGNPVASSLNNAWQLSEQVIIECCWADYDGNGCGGGGTSGPMQCAVDIGALPSTTSHPYLATTDNTTCSHKKTEAGAYVSSWYQPCVSGDEACLKSYIGGDSCSSFSTTTLKTSIQVIDSFYDYESGVYSDPTCPNNKHNHAVGIVGWGTDATTGTDYWIIRNSWGPDWANAGYMYMERGTNMCCVGCDNLFFQ